MQDVQNGCLVTCCFYAFLWRKAWKVCRFLLDIRLRPFSIRHNLASSGLYFFH